MEKWYEPLLKADSNAPEKYPEDWNVVLGPIIVHRESRRVLLTVLCCSNSKRMPISNHLLVYREGIIKPICSESGSEWDGILNTAGLPAALSEAHRPGKPDLFITISPKEKAVAENAQKQYPQRVDLLSRATSFAKQNGPDSRFALLRVWSAPHYYPIVESRSGLISKPTFVDGTGRMWEWEFCAKDSGVSQLFMNHAMDKRLEVVKSKLGEQIINGRDLVFVLGRNEEELFRNCLAVTLCIQTKPWTFELDPWKSFINVELELLKRLPCHWWE